MNPHEIFSRISVERCSTILAELAEGQKPLYKAVIAALAKTRNLRPVFVERKPRTERHAWMHEALGRKSNESVSIQVLQTWLVGNHSALLCDFLDALGIAHDEDGTVNNLPPAPPREALDAAVASLLEKHDRELVAIYLHAFQALDDTGWTSLEELLGSDPRVQI